MGKTENDHLRRKDGAKEKKVNIRAYRVNVSFLATNALCLPPLYSAEPRREAKEKSFEGNCAKRIMKSGENARRGEDLPNTEIAQKVPIIVLRV